MCLWGIVLPLVGKMPPWHLVAAVVAIVGVIYGMQLIGTSRDDYIESGLAIFIVQMLCASIPAFIFRAIGFRLTADTNDTQPLPLIQGILLAQGVIASKPAQRPFQFSLRTLFSWTSAAAVLLSAFSVLFTIFPCSHIILDSESLATSIITVFVSSFNLWLVFWDGFLNRRIMAFILISAVAVIIMFFGMIHPVGIVLLFLLELSTLFWLVLVRASGFRLRRTTVK